MEWNDRYSIGVHEIDEQHKVLFLLTNRLQSAIKIGKGDQEIAGTFRELINYTNYHFASEEHEMKEAAFTDIVLHQQFHKKLVDTIKDSLLRIRDGKRFNPIELLRFLNTWLIDHILEKDIKFAKFLKEKTNDPSSQIINGTEFLRKNLEKLKLLLRQNVMEMEIYISEKKKIIQTYIQSHQEWTRDDIREYCTAIDTFAKNQIVDESEKVGFKALLSGKFDVETLTIDLKDTEAASFRELLKTHGLG